MTRPLVAVSADDPRNLLLALRSALDRSGPAVLPVAAGRPLPASALAEVPHPTGVVIETSGSTGVPKRVALGCDALLASAGASETALGGPGQWLLALPAHYVAGVQVLVRSIAARTEPVLLEQGHFDPQRFIDASRTLTGDLRFTSLVPAQLIALLGSRAGIAALRRFDGVLVGGQAVPDAVRDRIELLGLPVFRTYGSSETAGGCVYNGVPLPGVEVEIVDGQAELSASSLAEGYLDANGEIDEERTDAAFVFRDGRRWYRTGDLATWDGGVLSVTGRADNVIVSGGVNVSLDRVERVVRGMPGLEHAVVVGVPDERWGEVPAVVAAAPAALDALRDAVGEALGKAARPAFVLLVDAVPSLSSGKPDRRAVARLAEDAVRQGFV